MCGKCLGYPEAQDWVGGNENRKAARIRRLVQGGFGYCDPKISLPYTETQGPQKKICGGS